MLQGWILTKTGKLPVATKIPCAIDRARLYFFQSAFLVLVEDAIRQTDLAKLVQRYQLAIGEAKVRLNFAVCLGGWLMPAWMVINTESTVDYNKQIKQAAPGIKLGVNYEIKRQLLKTQRYCLWLAENRK